MPRGPAEAGHYVPTQLPDSSSSSFRPLPGRFALQRRHSHHHVFDPARHDVAPERRQRQRPELVLRERESTRPSTRLQSTVRRCALIFMLQQPGRRQLCQRRRAARRRCRRASRRSSAGRNAPLRARCPTGLSNHKRFASSIGARRAQLPQEPHGSRRRGVAEVAQDGRAQAAGGCPRTPPCAAVSCARSPSGARRRPDRSEPPGGRAAPRARDRSGTRASSRRRSSRAAWRRRPAVAARAADLLVVRLDRAGDVDVDHRARCPAGRCPSRTRSWRTPRERRRTRTRPVRACARRRSRPA